jgi:hypothetical protein
MIKRTAMNLWINMKNTSRPSLKKASEINNYKSKQIKKSSSAQDLLSI